MLPPIGGCVSAGVLAWGLVVVGWTVGTMAVKGMWSPWFDEAPFQGVDNQSMVRIRQVFGYDCPVIDLLRTECRIKDSDSIFSNTAVYQGNYLAVPCNQAGVVCMDIDQIYSGLVEPCQDYQVRFLCRADDATINGEKELQTPLNVNGGFIAMAAGLSVVIPLVCVLIIQLRKAKREERQRDRRAQEGEGDEGGESGGENTSGPPPAYEQLFGPGHEAATGPALHSRHNSTDVLIQQNELVSGGSDEGQVNTGTQVQGPRTVIGHQEDSSRNESDDDDGDGGREVGGGGGGGGIIGVSGEVMYPPSQRIRRASVSAISGSEVVDFTLTSASSEGSLSSANVTQPQELYLTVAALDRGLGSPRKSIQPAHCPTSDTNTTDSSPSTTQSSSLQSPPSSTASSSSTPSSVSPSSSSPPTTTTTSNITTTSSTTSSRSPILSPSANEDTQGQSDRFQPPSSYRYPGMHISIEEYLSSCSHYDNESDGPPPSYEEALEILEKAEHAKG